MKIDWSSLGAALAFVCVLEGMLPFMNPEGMRSLMQKIAGMNDRELRIGGLCSMVAGVLILFAVRS
jgi:uncharacterized protein YjeT (DUF2065 family)